MNMQDAIKIVRLTFTWYQKEHLTDLKQRGITGTPEELSDYAGVRAFSDLEHIARNLAPKNIRAQYRDSVRREVCMEMGIPYVA